MTTSAVSPPTVNPWESHFATNLNLQHLTVLELCKGFKNSRTTSSAKIKNKKKWRGNIRSFRENPVVEYIYFDDSSMSIVNTNGVSGKFGSCLWLSMFCAPPPPAAAPLVFFSSLALLNMTVNPSAEAGLFTSHSPNLGKGRPLSCCQSKSSHNHNQQCRFDYNHKIS